MNAPVQVNFDASTVDPTTPFEVIPAGDYPVALTNAETKETNAKDGHYIACTYIVQEGEYKGRNLFDNLNIWNKSEKAREIAWRQLSGICHATGIIQVGVMDEMYGIMVTARVAIEEDEKYGPSNRIQAFSKLGSAPTAPLAPAPAPAPAPGVATPAPAPAVTADAPWAAPAPATADAPAPTHAVTAAPAPAPAPGPTAAPPWATG